MIKSFFQKLKQKFLKPIILKKGMNNKFPIPDEIKVELDKLPKDVQEVPEIKDFMSRKKSLMREVINAKNSGDIDTLKSRIREFKDLLQEEKKFANEKSLELESLFTELKNYLSSKDSNLIRHDGFETLRVAIVEKPKNMMKIYLDSIRPLEVFFDRFESKQWDDVKSLYSAFKVAMDAGENTVTKSKYILSKSHKTINLFNKELKEMQQCIELISKEYTDKEFFTQSLKDLGSLGGRTLLGVLIVSFAGIIPIIANHTGMDVFELPSLIIGLIITGRITLSVIGNHRKVIENLGYLDKVKYYALKND